MQKFISINKYLDVFFKYKYNFKCPLFYFCNDCLKETASLRQPFVFFKNNDEVDFAQSNFEVLYNR